MPSQPTSGSYNVNEAYVELSVPLFAGASSATGSTSAWPAAISDYSTFGSEFTQVRAALAGHRRAGVAYELGRRLPRADHRRAVRLGRALDLTLVDPCSNGNNPANCASLGVPAGFQQANPQISVTTGGNRELQPERARSFSAGFVWSPWFGNNAAWADRFDIEATFYRHQVDDAIQAIDAQTQLNLCVQTLDPQYCDGITRASTGGINSFNNRLTNLGSIKTDGWDVDLFWTLPITTIGRFKVTWQNTFVGRYEAAGAAGQQQPQHPGVEVNDSAIPEWNSNLALDWNLGAWNATWRLRHISGAARVVRQRGGFPGVPGPGGQPPRPGLGDLQRRAAGLPLRMALGPATERRHQQPVRQGPTDLPVLLAQWLRRLHLRHSGWTLLVRAGRPAVLGAGVSGLQVILRYFQLHSDRQVVGECRWDRLGLADAQAAADQDMVDGPFRAPARERRYRRGRRLQACLAI